MVVLRDGKRYEVGEEEAPASEPRPRRRTSTTAGPAPQQRRSRRSTAADAAPGLDLEPPSPAATPRRSKRTRGPQLDIIPMTPPPEEQLDDSEEEDTAKDQDIVPANAAQSSPTRGEGSPSPLPKKKARRDAKPKRSSSTRQGGSSWLLAGTAVVVLLAIAAAALWPQHGAKVTQVVQQALEGSCTYVDSLQLPDKFAAVYASAATATDSAMQLLQQHAGQAQAQLHAVLLQLHVRYPSLVPDKLGLGGGGGSSDPHAWAAEVLAGILPEGQQWQELAGDISDRLRTPAQQRGHKAAALLLACAADEDCSEAAAALAVLPPRGDACSLTIDGGAVAAGPGGQQPAAALQAQLAPFLRRCPRGLVILLRSEALPVAALSALHNGLSELGGFQHDGLVASSHAAYALLVQLPVQDVAGAAGSDAAAADAGIKAAFLQLKQQQLAALQAAVGSDAAQADALAAVGRTLTTLHRRLDFAAPVKLGAAAEDELDQLEQQAAAAQAAAAAAAAAEAAARQQQEEEAYA